LPDFSINFLLKAIHGLNYFFLGGKTKNMIFDTLYKLEAKWPADSTKHCKNHLSFNGGDALCGRKDVQGLGGKVEIKNGVWFVESIYTNEFTLPYTDEQVKKTFCKKCKLAARQIASNNSNANE
jgi:hypothetical protein